MYTTSKQSEVFRLLDTLLNDIDIEQLKTAAEASRVVARLRGTEPERVELGFITELVREHNAMQMEIISLRGELISLKDDLQTVMRAINKPFEPSSYNDFSNLKNKYGIYQ